MRSARIVLALMAVLGLAGGCGGQGQGPLIRIGTNVWPGYEPLYVARERGAYEGSNIRLVEYPSASEVIRAFRNQGLEMASLTLDEVLLLRESAIPVKVVLVHDVSDGADVIVARSGVKSMRGLKGKRIGVESGALGAYVLTRALEVNGMRLEEIEIVNLDVNLHEEAFLGGQIDAAVTFEPVRTRLLKGGGIEVFSSRQLPGEIIDVMVAREDVIAAHPGLVKQVVEGWFDALDYSRRHPQQAAEITSRRLKISPAEVIASLQGLSILDREHNAEMLRGQAAQINVNMQTIQRVLEQHGLVRQGVDIHDIIYDAGF